jgi:lactose/L-arabinose transport system substrate-binding protein
MARPSLKWLAFIVAAGVAAGAAGCASSPQFAANSEPIAANAPASKVHGDISVWSWNIAAQALRNLTPAYNKEYPGVHVDVEMTGSRQQTRFMLALAAGVGAPDISQLQNTDSPHYMATDQLADLTAVASKYQSDFPPSVWRLCTQDGRVYAIPWDIGPCAVFYKRDLFKKYGVDPNKIDTWDDYIAAGRTILSKSGGRTKMMTLGENDIESFYEVLLQENGGQIFDANGDIAIDSPQARQALDVIRRIRQSGIYSDVAAYSAEWLSGFSDDTIASYPGAFWLGGTIKDSVGKGPGAGDWGVFRLPALTPGGLHVANWGGSVLVIPAQCPNKQAAWSFIQYALCTRQGQLTQYRTEDLFPSFLPALKSADVDARDPFFAGQQVGRLFATDVTKIQTLNRTGTWAEATGYVSQDLSHWGATGMPPDEPFLSNLADKMHRRLQTPIAPAATASNAPTARPAAARTST